MFETACSVPVILEGLYLGELGLSLQSAAALWI